MGEGTRLLSVMLWLLCAVPCGLNGW